VRYRYPAAEKPSGNCNSPGTLGETESN